MPKVSVIVPIYGVEKYIERCAVSLFEQTLDDIEYLFINDCTKDRSIEILKSTLNQYKNRVAQVNIINMSVNSGQAAVRKYGIGLAKGEYVIHCDSDDWMEKDMLSLLYAKAHNDSLDVLFCDYFRVVNGDKIICRNNCLDNDMKNNYFSCLLTRKCFTAVWNKLIRTSLYHDYFIQYPKCNMWEDYVLSVQIFYYANKIDYLSIPLYNYYCNQNSITFSDPKVKVEQVVSNCNLILKFLNDVNIQERYSDELIVLKNTAREELLGVVDQKEYLDMWKRIYPEINSLYIYCPIVSIWDKLKFLSLLCGIYSKIHAIRMFIYKFIR